MAAPVPVDKGTVGTASLGTSGTTNVVPTCPATVNAGDILWLLVGICCITTFTDAVFVAPAGWDIAAQGTIRNSGGTVRGRAALMLRRADGTEDGTTVTVATTATVGTANLGSISAQIYRVSGAVAAGTPYDDAVTGDTGSGGAPGTSAPRFQAVAVSGTERTLLAFIYQGDDDPGAGAPSGYASTIAADLITANTPDSQLVVFDLQNVSSDGAVDGSNGEANGYRTFHASVIPAAAASGHGPLLASQRNRLVRAA